MGRAGDVKDDRECRDGRRRERLGRMDWCVIGFGEGSGRKVKAS